MRSVSADPKDQVVVGDDGSIRVAGRGAALRLRDRAGKYRVTLDMPGLIVLRGERPESATAARVLMAGEIVSRMTLLEIVNMVANANWRGELHIYGPDAWRMLVIDQGALKHATSDHPDDRLGEVLYRLGALSRAQLENVLREMTPERRLGQIVVERGLVKHEKMFFYLQRQAEQIFYASLLVSAGSYLFGAPDETAAPPPTTIHVPLQSLLLEGVQRIDEMALFRARIPNLQACPEVQPVAGRVSLDQKAMTVLMYADGSRTIEEIARQTGFGEFETLKTIYHLMQVGQVVLRTGAQVDSEAVRSLVGQFNDVMRDIFAAIATYGGIEQTRATLAAWITNTGYAPFFGDRVEEDGTLSADRVVDALERAPVDHPLEGLHQALHELAAFALFSATTWLPRDQELLLARDVNRRLKAIRL